LSRLSLAVRATSGLPVYALTRNPAALTVDLLAQSSPARSSDSVIAFFGSPVMPLSGDDLVASRESSLELMTRINSGPVDLTDTVASAQAQVSGHADPIEALAAFATLMPPMDAERAHTAAADRIAGSISHIFGAATYSRDGRKVAASDGNKGGIQNDDTIWAEVVNNVAIHAQMVATGIIHPAQEVLIYEHRISREHLIAIAREFPVVPDGHEQLWAAGLTLGINGDYGPASAILIPQLEQVIRVLLKRRGIHTLFVNDQTGVESEKSLNALLDMPETRLS